MKYKKKIYFEKMCVDNIEYFKRFRIFANFFLNLICLRFLIKIFIYDLY